jgi:hypothetical protein
MLSEELRNVAGQLAALRQEDPAALAKSLRTAEEVLRDLAEDAAHLERQVVPAGARLASTVAAVLPPGVVSLAAVQGLRTGGAL